MSCCFADGDPSPATSLLLVRVIRQVAYVERLLQPLASALRRFDYVVFLVNR